MLIPQKHRMATETQRMMVAIVVAIGFCIGVRWLPLSHAAEETSTPKKTSAHSATSNAQVERRLQEILNRQEEIRKTQQTILQKFDAVMEELRIIKVRATR